MVRVEECSGSHLLTLSLCCCTVAVKRRQSQHKVMLATISTLIRNADKHIRFSLYETHPGPACGTNGERACIPALADRGRSFLHPSTAPGVPGSWRNGSSGRIQVGRLGWTTSGTWHCFTRSETPQRRIIP